MGYSPPPHWEWGWDSSRERKALYFRQTITLSSELGRVDLGILLYREEESPHLINGNYYTSDQERRLLPVLGVELGEPGVYVYGRFLNSFPLFTGGGAYEIGISGRSREIYEHKFYVAVSASRGTGMGTIGYRGEFRIYKKLAITPGFSVGGNDRDNVYSFTFGIKTILDHNRKKSF